MCLGCQASLGELLSLRTYGRAFSRTDGPSFRVRWSDDAQTVSWANGKLCLSAFRSFAQQSIELARTLLEQMMYRLRPRIDLNYLHDEMSVVKQGYSFVQDPRNNLSTRYLELSSRACLDRENGLMSGESLKSKAVQHYLNQNDQLLKQLGLLLHLTRHGNKQAISQTNKASRRIWQTNKARGVVKQARQIVSRLASLVSLSRVWSRN
jgi:hypothetical protein